MCSNLLLLHDLLRDYCVIDFTFIFPILSWQDMATGKGLAKIILFLFSICFSLIIAEIALRIFWYSPYTDPKYLRDDQTWLKEYTKLNRFNYRDREFSLVKQPDTFRVYTLGDSYTFGWYINDSLLTYPKILEKKLQTQYGLEKIEVINASRHGFGPEEEYNRLILEGSKFNPDLILVGFNIFDFTEFKGLQPLIKNSTIRNLFLYQVTLGSVDRAKTSNNLLQAINSAYQANSPQMNKTDRIFKKFKKAAEDLQAKLIFIIFPHYNSVNPNQSYQFASYHQQLHQLALKNNIEIIDLLEPFNYYQDKKELVLNPTDSHPSILAHQVAGETIAKAIETQQLIQTQPAKFNILELTVSPDLKLDNLFTILSLNPSSWLYFDQRLDLGIQKIFLPESNDRQIYYLEDSLQTVSGAADNRWPGARLTYYLPGNNQQVSIPQTLYNFPIVGIAGISIFHKELGSLSSQDLNLKDTIIKKDHNKISISFHADQEVILVKLVLDMAIFQFDISKDHLVQDFMMTKVIKENLEPGQQQIALKINPQINSTNINYLWVDNQQYPATFTKEANLLKIQLAETSPTTRSLEFPLAQIIDTDNIEFPAIQYLSLPNP